MHASADDYKCPNKATDHIILSYNGHIAYLIIDESAFYQVCIFITSSKEPPIHIIHAFMKNFVEGTGIVHTDQDGKLNCSNALHNSMLKNFGHVVEPTKADSPSQNGSAEI
jgi:hypothetical protein